MKRLTTDNPQGNFETMLNYVYSKDGVAYIRSDGATDDVPLHEWAKRECIARGCDKSMGETMEEIDEAICGCAFDCPECPIFLAYTFACQACHLRDRLKRYEDAEEDGRLVALPCKIGDTLFDTTMGNIRELTIKSIPIMLFQNGSIYISFNVSNFRGAMLSIEMWQIGKTVFLTREEAEGALKGGAE